MSPKPQANVHTCVWAWISTSACCINSCLQAHPVRSWPLLYENQTSWYEKGPHSDTKYRGIPPPTACATGISHTHSYWKANGKTKSTYGHTQANSGKNKRTAFKVVITVVEHGLGVSTTTHYPRETLLTRHWRHKTRQGQRSQDAFRQIGMKHDSQPWRKKETRPLCTQIRLGQMGSLVWRYARRQRRTLWPSRFFCPERGAIFQSHHFCRCDRQEDLE